MCRAQAFHCLSHQLSAPKGALIFFILFFFSFSLSIMGESKIKSKTFVFEIGGSTRLELRTMLCSRSQCLPSPLWCLLEPSVLFQTLLVWICNGTFFQIKWLLSYLMLNSFECTGTNFLYCLKECRKVLFLLLFIRNLLEKKVDSCTVKSVTCINRLLIKYKQSK